MRIVILLRHAFYLRHFESVLRTLAERGHDITLVFTPFPRYVDYSLRDALLKAVPEYRRGTYRATHQLVVAGFRWRTHATRFRPLS